MSAFTPDPGTLFYVSPRWFLGGGDFFGGDVKERTRAKDRSYNDKVLRCVAFDERLVVGEIVYGSSYGDSKRVFLREEYEMFPVGPEVMQALGLTPEPEQASPHSPHSQD
jgi:hypothetical protein